MLTSDKSAERSPVRSINAADPVDAGLLATASTGATEKACGYPRELIIIQARSMWNHHRIAAAVHLSHGSPPTEPQYQDEKRAEHNTKGAHVSYKGRRSDVCQCSPDIPPTRLATMIQV